MAIEITRSGLYQFRQNPYQPRELDFRRNKVYARWQRLGVVYDSAEEARAVLLQLDKGKARPERTQAQEEI